MRSEGESADTGEDLREGLEKGWRRVAEEGDGVGKDFFKGRRAVSTFVGQGTRLAEDGSPTGGPGRGRDAGATAAWGWPSEEVAGTEGARGSPVDGLSAQQEQDRPCTVAVQGP